MENSSLQRNVQHDHKKEENLQGGHELCISIIPGSNIEVTY